MIDPLFWLGLSILLVAVSLTAVLVAAIPAFQELARAARSAEKLFDTLSRELPPTLESIRLTGLEITDFTDEVANVWEGGVKNATEVVKQLDQTIVGAKKQAENVNINTRGFWVGVKTAWRTFKSGSTQPRNLPRLPSGRRSKGDRSSSQRFYQEDDP